MSSGIKATPDAPPRLAWQVARVVERRVETPHARTIVLDIPKWPGHRAGQHVDVRLVAEDGYQAQRSYSIASAPEDATVSLTVECIETGDVSPYLCDVLQVGDGLEVRGPIGGYFVWEASAPEPLFLVAGGSGVVPLMAMLRHRTHAAVRLPARLLYSVRMVDDILYRHELDHLMQSADVGVAYALTRGAPDDWHGYRRRIDRAMLEQAGFSAEDMPLVYVCGPTPLVESAATLLVDLGHDPSRVKTERFGPTT